MIWSGLRIAELMTLIGFSIAQLAQSVHSANKRTKSKCIAWADVPSAIFSGTMPRSAYREREGTRWMRHHQMRGPSFSRCLRNWSLVVICSSVASHSRMSQDQVFVAHVVPKGVTNTTCGVFASNENLHGPRVSPLLDVSCRGSRVWWR